MKNILLLPLITFLCASALAQIEPEPQIKEREKNVVYTDSSEYGRYKKTYYLALKNRGLEAGYYLNRNRLVTIEGMSYSDWGYSGSSSTSYSYERRENVNNFGVYFKHFTGNSFYYRVGADYWAVDSYDITVSNGVESGYRLAGHRFGASAGIGNQWHWKYFNVGFDWITLSVPLTHSLSKDTARGTYASSSRDHEKDRWFRNPRVSLLNLTLGLSF